MEAVQAGRPSTKVIVGIAVALFGCVLVAIAIHKLLSTGTCSSTGYTEYGPAPRCPKGSGWYGGFLTLGIILAVVSGAFVGSNPTCAGLFLAIGVGSLLVAFSPHPKIGVAFPAIFGGCFAAGGLVWAAYAWNGRPIRPRARPAPAPAVPVIAGLGPAAERTGPRLPRIGMRPVIAAVIWAAVAAGAIELGHVVDTHTKSAVSVDVTRAPLPRPTGAAGTVRADSAGSMFKFRNLEGALIDLTARFGSDGSVVALAIYPGQLDAVVADGEGDAQLVTETPHGEPHVGPAVPFEGSRQAVNVSQIHADVPERLAGEIATRGGVPTARLDRFVLDLSGPLAAWRIYPAGGGARFEARLTGGELERVSTQGKQPLN